MKEQTAEEILHGMFPEVQFPDKMKSELLEFGKACMKQSVEAYKKRLIDELEQHIAPIYGLVPEYESGIDEAIKIIHKEK